MMTTTTTLPPATKTITTQSFKQRQQRHQRQCGHEQSFTRDIVPLNTRVRRTMTRSYLYRHSVCL